jgi:hypothetical protein
MAKLPLSCCQAREHHGTEMKVQREWISCYCYMGPVLCQYGMMSDGAATKMRIRRMLVVKVFDVTRTKINWLWYWRVNGVRRASVAIGIENVDIQKYRKTRKKSNINGVARKRNCDTPEMTHMKSLIRGCWSN